MAESGFEHRERDPETCGLRLVPRSPGIPVESPKATIAPVVGLRLWRELKEPIVASPDVAPGGTFGLDEPAPGIVTRRVASVLCGPGCLDPKTERCLDSVCIVVAVAGLVVAMWAGLG